MAEIQNASFKTDVVKHRQTLTIGAAIYTRDLTYTTTRHVFTDFASAETWLDAQRAASTSLKINDGTVQRFGDNGWAVVNLVEQTYGAWTQYNPQPSGS